MADNIYVEEVDDALASNSDESLLAFLRLISKIIEGAYSGRASWSDSMSVCMCSKRGSY